jgi:hypothetical protein
MVAYFMTLANSPTLVSKHTSLVYPSIINDLVKFYEVSTSPRMVPRPLMRVRLRNRLDAESTTKNPVKSSWGQFYKTFYGRNL